MTDDGVSEYTWDRANRLKSVGAITYTYDGLGNRIQLFNQLGSSATETTTYLPDMQGGLTEVLQASTNQSIYGNSSSITRTYVHEPRGLGAYYLEKSGMAYAGFTPRWMDTLEDGLGSIRAEINHNSQAIAGTRTMNPYGDVMTGYNYGAMDSGYGFTGEQIDPNELVYLRARYYDPNVGVFASLDPFEGVHNRPMSVNGYSWVEGNVANWTDASGRCVDNMVANAIGQLTNINACNLLGFDDTACSLYTARNSTVTIAAFGVYNGPDTRSIIGMGAIVQHNGKEYLLTSDHFGSRANTCSSLYNLGIDRPFLYLEGIRGGKVFYVPNMEQSCIPQSGYTLISIKDGNQSFGITSGIAQLKTENMLNRSSGVRVAYGYISGSNRNSFQTLSKTFDIQVGTGIVTLRDIQFVYQPYSRLTFSMGSLFADSMSIPNNPATSRWRILFGEGSQGDSGNVAFNNQYAVAVFERQDPAPYLFANLWQIPGAIITGSADFPVKDDIYAPIQQYP